MIEWKPNNRSGRKWYLVLGVNRREAACLKNRVSCVYICFVRMRERDEYLSEYGSDRKC